MLDFPKVVLGKYTIASGGEVSYTISDIATKVAAWDAKNGVTSKHLWVSICGASEVVDEVDPKNWTGC